MSDQMNQQKKPAPFLMLGLLMGFFLSSAAFTGNFTMLIEHGSTINTTEEWRFYFSLVSTVIFGAMWLTVFVTMVIYGITLIVSYVKNRRLLSDYR